MKYTKRRRWVTASICALVFLAAACGSSGEATDPDGEVTAGTSAPVGTSPADGPAASVEPGPYCDDDCRAALQLEAPAESIECTVGLSWNTAGHPFGATSISRSEEVVGELFPNMTLHAGDGQGDSATQTSQIEDLLVRGIDVLIISPVDAAALAPVVDRAREEGVQVVASDRSVDTEVATYLGADNVAAGEVAGEFVAELLSDGGRVAVLQGSLGASPTIDRQAGFVDALASSGVEVIADQSADYDRAEGLRVMEDYLQRFGQGEIDAVFAHNDEMALGAIQAIEESGRLDEIAVVGIDGQESALDAVEAGKYEATVVYPIPVPEHLIAAAKLCAGEELPERIVTSATLVTQENVDEVRGTTF